MKKYFLISILLLVSLVGISGYEYIRFNNGKLHVVFCNVGQGDAIFIRSPKGTSVLVDAGPNERVLQCLGGHMPFWQRQIDLLLLSHPHLDHFAGVFDLLKQYRIVNFATENLNNPVDIYQELRKGIEEKGIRTKHLLAGDTFRLHDGVIVKVLGPSKGYLQETSPTGIIGEREEFASLILLVQYKDFSMLLTGDSQASGIEDAITNFKITSTSVLQVPHHGSKTGLDSSLIERLNPDLAVISVGKNRYGHPSKETLRLLQESQVKVVRTDQDGDIEIVTDGKSFVTD